VDRRFLSQHRLPAQQERDLERQDSASIASRSQFGTMITGPITTDMAKVRQRKRDMVEREIELHLHNYRTTGAELIMGSARFVAPTTLEVRLNDGGTRVLAGDQVSSTSARTP
jgi:pyruvate/2-oxoglutarate dehydrogenase complex dihydrolipoamide dehydrogenase (E3) component